MKTALIVEDYKSLNEIYKIALERAGLKVTAVEEAEDALKHIQKNPYDVLLLDLMLQDMSGLELLRRIDAPTNYPNMKIFAISNLTNAEIKLEVMRLGATKYIVKAEHAPKDIIDIINQHVT